MNGRTDEPGTGNIELLKVDIRNSFVPLFLCSSVPWGEPGTRDAL